MSQLRKSAEDYLESILVLKSQHPTVHSVDVAHYMSFSKPSVSRAMGKLKQDGYIEMAPSGELTLTAMGQEVAENIYERHTILSSLLQNLGVGQKAALEDACLVEHVISDESFACIKAFVKSGAPTGAAAAGEKDDKKKKKKKKK